MILNIHSLAALFLGQALESNPHVAQVFLIEREVIKKKTGKTSCEIPLGLTSRPPNKASPERLQAFNHGHWRI